MKDEALLYGLNREKLLIVTFFFSSPLHLFRFLYAVCVVDCVIMERIERKQEKKKNEKPCEIKLLAW